MASAILKGLATNDGISVKNGIDRLRNGNQQRRQTRGIMSRTMVVRYNS